MRFLSTRNRYDCVFMSFIIKTVINEQRKRDSLVQDFTKQVYIALKSVYHIIYYNERIIKMKQLYFNKFINSEEGTEIKFNAKKGILKVTVHNNNFNIIELMDSICIVVSEICHRELKDLKERQLRNQTSSSDEEVVRNISIGIDPDNTGKVTAELSNVHLQMYPLINDLCYAVEMLKASYSSLEDTERGDE